MTNAADLIRECFQRVREGHKPGTGGHRSQDGIANYYRLVSEMTDRLLRGSHQELRQTLASLGSREQAFVNGIVVSAATRAVREESVDRLEIGTKGILVESFIQDDREVLMDLALLNHSATKLGVRLEPMLRSACARFSNAVDSEFVELVDSFYERPTRELSDFAWAEGVNEDGEFTYVRAW